MKLSLNATTGTLHLAASSSISSATSAAELATLFAPAPVEHSAAHGGYTHYFIRAVPLDEGQGSFRLIYFHQRLDSISFAFYPDGQAHLSWNDWSEQQEQRLAAEYDAWLTKQVGSRRQFAWGTVWAEYDPRSGGSSIGMRYAL
ncbi:hypothetical protein [Hymenobacter persicinus]|uniref:Uncharacterized protein n=1 Tax=Hymenobacter persicinus TaxID=2025506 RepID=A0A4Q5LIV8_9BACT|nr:hypothetical protein [Hymenobacter persicinus]RYU83237.1 hypothetical protein EWM57_02825 [Hymenobacter persicinus]